jgi:hypothetical protein
MLAKGSTYSRQINDKDWFFIADHKKQLFSSDFLFKPKQTKLVVDEMLARDREGLLRLQTILEITVTQKCRNFVFRIII